ncbi:hypothetical protein [Agrobacterium cavarae]|uniref:hypothetical protein n=1 Tax=Agrobacterium cavarae TaxID=2528239 RepID=UPI003FD226DD
MDDREKLALAALARMVDQYLEKRPDGTIDNYSMSAGEDAFEALQEYGYMEVEDGFIRFARWTQLGEALFAWSDRPDENPFPDPM